jgi:O-antigen/teichoic acid export membrane protein
MFKKIKEFLFENRNARQTVAKNTFWLSVSNFGGRAIKAAVIIYAARILGTAGYGIFSYAVTLSGFMGLFLDPGVNTVLMRDSAKAQTEEERQTLFSTTLVIKLGLIAIGAALVLILGPIVTTLPGALPLIPIVAVILTFDTLREFLFSFFRSVEKMEWEAGIFLATNLGILIFGFIFLLASPTPASLAWGYAVGTTLGGIFATIVLWNQIKESLNRFSAKLIGPLLQTAWPFAVVGALGLLLTNTDILIISWMKTASDVGIYSAAIRIIQVLYLVPAILQVSTLPLFSRLAKVQHDKFRSTLERSITMIFLCSIPMAIGGIVLGTQIMSFVFGPDFAAGGLSFKLLMATLIVDYPGSLIVNAIFTYGHQKSLIITSAIGGISNVILDVLLIPHFGIAGSAVATLIAQTLSNGYLWYTMKQLNDFSILPYLGKILAASGVMLAVTLALLAIHTETLVNIIISTIAYLVALYVFREPLIEEVLAIRR